MLPKTESYLERVGAECEQMNHIARIKLLMSRIERAVSVLESDAHTHEIARAAALRILDPS